MIILPALFMQAFIFTVIIAAITADPTNPVYYEKRIETLEDAGLHILTMKTRFAAAQNVDRSRVPFEWFRKMITIVSFIKRFFKPFSWLIDCMNQILFERCM